jgi:hypothetical protein
MRIKMTLAVALLVGSSLSVNAQGLLAAEQTREPSTLLVIEQANRPAAACGLICITGLGLGAVLLIGGIGSGGGT